MIDVEDNLRRMAIAKVFKDNVCNMYLVLIYCAYFLVVVVDDVFNCTFYTGSCYQRHGL